MARIYRRTENGTETLISVSKAMVEVNYAMMGGRRAVRSMSSGQGNHQIEYKDGRKVSLVEIEGTIPVAPVETDSAGQRIVTVKGKRYIVGSVIPPRVLTHVSYWTERNGKTFGATRFAAASDKPGTVGRTIWDALSS